MGKIAERKKAAGQGDSESSSDDDDDAPAVLSEALLAKCFRELSESERLARMESDVVASHFKVILRGCDASEASTGDRIDVGRAQFVDTEVERWCETHFHSKSKSYKLLLVGEVEAGKLLREWCRKMQYYWDLWAEHGSWEAAGGAAAFDAYTETVEYTAWVDSLPPGSVPRLRAMELRKLRPRMP